MEIKNARGAEFKNENYSDSTPYKSVSMPFDIVSHVDSDHPSTTQVDEETEQSREKRSMNLTEKIEPKK